MKFKIPAMPALLAILAFTVMSCSGGRIGYLVMHWPPEETGLKSGEIVSVISESDIRNVYVVEDSDKSLRKEVPRFTGRFFRKKNEAEEYQKKFIPFKNMFAYSETALPVREKPDALSERVYRLRPSQVVKIIEKQTGLVTVGNLEGYWYLVLTEDGYEGYCFDRNLNIYEFEGEKTSEESEKEYLEGFFRRNWYPTSYLEAVESGRIEIKMLAAGEGIFPDYENKKLVIITRDEKIEYTFESIAGAGHGRVIFRGTPVEIIFYPDNRLYVTFMHRGIDYSGFYTLLEKSIDQYIREEQERRAGIIRKLYAGGTSLVSELNGAMALRPGGKFIWTGYINLVPDIIPFGYGVSGFLKADYYLSQSLSGDFDGVISFQFENTGREVVFALSFTSDGVLFTHVPAEYITDEMVTNLPVDRNTYYFRYTASQEQE